ncbi:MAG: PEGA domain-containing protein [Gammaproteobacteria bacterium]|nr:PEGA domain-containing protein [Gammaproteobacteria bacterium]
MQDFPLQTFLASLAADGIIPGVRDYDRLLLAFRTGGVWTLPRLKNVLCSLLAKDEDQQHLLGRKFDLFFRGKTDREIPEFDIRRVLKDLNALESRPAPQTEEPEEEPEEEPLVLYEPKSRTRFFLSVLAALLLLVVSGYGLRLLLKPPPLPTGPQIELSRRALDFGAMPLHRPGKKELTITNTGDKDLVIDEISLPEEMLEMFNAELPPFPWTIPPQTHKKFPVSCLLKEAKLFTAKLTILHNAEHRSDTVLLKGLGLEEDEKTVRKRLYPNAPYVQDVKYEALKPSKTWQKYAGLVMVLGIITLLYGLYLRHLRQGPQDRKSVWDENAPKMFHPGTIGGKPQDWLDQETLSELADSMGYFRSEQPGRKLDVAASIKATVKHGGIPTCDFHRRSQLWTLLILEDANAEALDWNPVSKELAAGMRRYGVPVISGQFRGSPEIFRTPDGHVYHLEDLEDRRRGILLLLFTDGGSFFRPHNAFALEAIARWPMIAWMDLREQRFWDETLDLPRKYKIPIYPTTRNGVLQAVRRFLTERGTSKEGSSTLQPEQMDAIRKLEPITHILGDALPWAQDCAMIQPITEGLADALRRKFHDNVPPGRIECLYMLPNTTRTAAGLHFSNETLKVLRRGFLESRSEEEQQAVLQFLLDEVEKAKPKEEENSLAYLSWEAVRERVRLDLGAEDDLQRFGELLHTPLAKSLGDSLANFGFPDQPESIPLRTRPKHKKALQRLARVKNHSFKIGDVISRWHRVGLGALVASLLISAGLTLYALLTVPPPASNLDVIGPAAVLDNTPARLDIKENDVWQRVKQVNAATRLAEGPLIEERRYRLSVYGKGHTATNKFELGKNQKAILLLGEQNEVKDCVEIDREKGVTIQRCPEAGERESGEPVSFTSWRERLGAPADRLMSVAVEVFDGNTQHIDAATLRNTLLATGSVDAVYRVFPDRNGVWQPNRFLATLQTEIPQKSQLVWWESGQTTSGISHEMFVDFDRGLHLGADATWINKVTELFKPGTEAIVNEAELVQVLGEHQASGAGAPITLIRPLKTEFALTVNTTPEVATVRIINSDIPYKHGVLLNPGQYEIEVSSEGYETKRETVVLEKEDKTVEVQLVEIPTGTTGTLAVSVEPASASIQVTRLDGSETLIVKRAEPLELPSGEWMITIRAKGYEIEEHKVEITTGIDRYISIQLAELKSEYALTVNTIPEDARVRIMNIKPVYQDGILLSQGRYDIEVSSDGYEMYREWTELARDTVLEVELVEISTGRLTVTAQPNFAEIQIARADGSERQIVTSGAQVELTPGEWLITANADGYEPAELSIEIANGQKENISLQLAEIKVVKTQTGTLIVTTEPTSASIQVARSDGSENRAMERNTPVELPEGEWLITAQAEGYEPSEEPVNVAKGEELSITLKLKTILQEFSVSKFSTLAFNGRVGEIIFSPVNTYFAVKTDTEFLLYNNKFEEIWRHDNDADTVLHVIDFSFNEKYFAFISGPNEELISILSLANKEIVQLKGHSEVVVSVAFSPDGQFLASGSDDTVKIWKSTSGQFTEYQTLTENPSSVWSVAFSLDGQFLTSGGYDGTVKIWKSTSGQFTVRQTLTGHSNQVTSVVFSPDGQFLVSGSHDGTVKTWKSTSGQFTEHQILTGHSDLVWSVTFSPDGQFLASGSDDNTVKIWKLTDGKFIERQTLTGHSNNVYSVSFSPDGQFLASGSADKTVKIWKLTGVGGK